MTSSSSEGNARRWFVTGASSGIGRAIIERAFADGDAVIASVRKPQALNDLQSLFPQTLEVEPLDVRDHEAISATVKRVLRRRPVDIVVNNAGYGAVGAAEELTSGHVDDQRQTLLHGPIAITRAFLPGLREHGGGRIVQMSSIGGQNRGSRGKRVPRRQNGGLEGFTESVAWEVADSGIRFTLIEPGAIRTGFGQALQFASPLAADQTGPVAEFRRYAAGEMKSTPGVLRKSHRSSST